MPGKHATDHQVRRYMNSRKEGYSQAAAAARAGISERTGRRFEADPVLPSQQDRIRRYRTRQDPFVEVWCEELVPMLQTIPHLRATTILAELQRRHPGRYPDRLLRSLQRRVAHWRATEGPERELIFRQEHPPGRQALSDFTNGGGLAVTIAGAPFPHLLYHFWLAFSGWQYVKAICGGESFTALTESLQEALWQLGGVPCEHRTDRLSAAYRNLSSQEDEAARYAEFCRHYSMEPTRNNAGVSHENGSVEAAHGHLKSGLGEALELRGSSDFPDLAAYQAFLQEFIARKNAPRRAVLAIELAALLPLPRHRTTDFSTATVTVTRSATISVRTVLYTVPSRLIGCRLKVHVYDDRLVCYLGTTPVLTVGRRHFKRHGPRVRVSTTATSSAAWSRSRKPSVIQCSATSCSRAWSSAAPGRRWMPGSSRARPAASMSACCISPLCTAARQRSPIILPPCSTPAALPISKRHARRWHRRPRRARQQCRCLSPTLPVTTSC